MEKIENKTVLFRKINTSFRRSKDFPINLLRGLLKEGRTFFSRKTSPMSSKRSLLVDQMVFHSLIPEDYILKKAGGPRRMLSDFILLNDLVVFGIFVFLWKQCWWFWINENHLEYHLPFLRSIRFLKVYFFFEFS